MTAQQIPGAASHSLADEADFTWLAVLPRGKKRFSATETKAKQTVSSIGREDRLRKGVDLRTAGSQCHPVLALKCFS